MLHPRVRRHNEIARKPRAQKNQKCRYPVSDSPEPLFSEKKQSQETRFQKKRKHAFHRQRLPDHSSRGLRKRRPVRPELEFHRNSRHDAERKINSENPRPESRRAIVVFIPGAQCFRLQVDQQQRKPHRQLRKNIVKGDSEGELQPVYVHCLSHSVPRRERPSNQSERLRRS